MKSQHRCRKSKKRVHFDKRTSVQTFDMDFTKDDVDDLWYSKTEQKSIKKNVARDIKRGNLDNSENDFTLRGLEKYVGRGGFKQYTKRIRDFRRSIIEMNDALEEKSSEEMLAEFCVPWTKVDAERALRLGRSDAKAAAMIHLTRRQRSE